MSEIITSAEIEVGTENNMEEFKKLQQRLNHESIRHQFKKKVVGGLDEGDVTKYIEDIEGKFKQLEQSYKKATDDIYVLRTKLTGELEEKYKLEENNKKIKQDLDTYIFECKQKDLTINSINEQYNSENEILKSQVLQMTEEKIELEKRVDELNIKFEQIKETAAKSEEERQSLAQSLLESESINEKIKEHTIQLESDNYIIQKKLSIIEEENYNVAEIEEENKKMTEEIKTFEELLNQSSVELEQLRLSSDEFGKENTAMKAKITELENKLSSKDYKINEINRVCTDLKQELEIEKSCSEKLNMDLVIFKQKIISLEGTINENLEELDMQKKSREKIEQELAVEKSKMLNYKVNGYKEELSDIFKKIEILEEEAGKNLQSSAYLYEQLAIQQSRAEKAESDLAAFVKLLSGAQDKFYSERNYLGDQFTQLVEIQKSEKTND